MKLASASPSLANFIRSVVQDITNPATGATVYSEWNEKDGTTSPFGRVPYVGISLLIKKGLLDLEVIMLVFYNMLVLLQVNIG